MSSVEKDNLSCLTQHVKLDSSVGIDKAACVDPNAIVVIPVHNYTRALDDIVKRALAAHNHVLVIDDGSNDKVAKKLSDFSVNVIRHAQHLGKGVAIQTAVGAARGLGMTHMIAMDADGRHNPADVNSFITAISEHPDALIIGRPDFQAQNLAGSHKRQRQWSNFWFRLQTGIRLDDAGCSFRAYPLGMLENLKLRTRKNTFDLEVLVKAAWAGVTIKAVDITACFTPPAAVEKPFLQAAGQKLWRLLLNIHLTMRSITPLPHRKIESDHDRPGEKISVIHPLRSIKTLLTENITPGELAVAGALGVFLGTLPLIAVHTITILFAAGYFRLNKVAALAASQLCMPPIVPALCIEVGHFLRHGRFLTEISLETLGYQALERLYEWLLGSLVLAPVLAAAAGGIIFGLASFVKKGILKRDL